MNLIDFTQRLVKRFPALSKQEASLDDIEAYVKTLKDDDRAKLWAEFLDTYGRDLPPKRATFVELGKALGLRQSFGFGGKIPMFRCDCLAEYPPHVRGCPKCGNLDKSKRVAVMVPGELPPAQPDPPWRAGPVNDQNERALEEARIALKQKNERRF